MTIGTFIGFSTSAERSSKRSWVLYDVELIKRDLANHFQTRIGERVMRPEFGCRIWEYIMEPNIEMNSSAIQLEVERICRLDVRLDVKNIQLFTKDHTIIVTMELIYRPFLTTEIFTVAFDKRQSN